MHEDQPPATRPFAVNAIHTVATAQMLTLQLSAMADQKASILMGATFVIFTITIGQAASSAAPAPVLVLGAAAFVSAIFAVLAILPATQFKSGGRTNLLFFGSFTQLSEAEYLDRLVEGLRDEETMYRTIGRDIYQNGTVLARKKYRLLGYAYRIFLVGLTASCFTLVVQLATAR